jgi:hypothetical protein
MANPPSKCQPLRTGQKPRPSQRGLGTLPVHADQILPTADQTQLNPLSQGGLTFTGRRRLRPRKGWRPPPIAARPEQPGGPLEPPESFGIGYVQDLRIASASAVAATSPKKNAKRSAPCINASTKHAVERKKRLISSQTALMPLPQPAGSRLYASAALATKGCRIAPTCTCVHC